MRLPPYRPRSADFMRRIAPLGGRAGKGRKKPGRRPRSLRPWAEDCDRLSPYDVLHERPAAEGVARLAAREAVAFAGTGEWAYLVRVVRPGRGVFFYWVCPGLGCHRRVFVLYRPTLAARWRCRRCAQVRYRARKASEGDRDWQRLLEGWQERRRAQRAGELG